jgi:cell division protein FtsB
MADDQSKVVAEEETLSVAPETVEEQVESVEEVAVEEATVEVVEEVVEETEVITEVDPTIASIFEGVDLSDEFKNKVSVVFEAAINEQVQERSKAFEADLTEKLEAELQESLTGKVEEIVENLDKYLDYVVEEWMSENEIAIEAGIKVEMAESLMTGLKDLFEEHNVDIDDETVDVVTGLEEQVATADARANDLVNENIALAREIADMKADGVFAGMTEDLTVSQRERIAVLSEKLDRDDLESYAANLQTIKESFFAESSVKKDEVVEEEIITEEAAIRQPISDYSSVNALVEALNARKSN